MTKYYLPRLVEDVEGKRCLCRKKRLIPMVVISFFMSMSIFLGFSFLIIPEGYIGYFDCDSNNCTIEKIYSSGLHLDFPWNKGFQMFDVSDKNVTLNGTYKIHYKVINERVYLNRVRSLGSIDDFYREIGNTMKTKSDLVNVQRQKFESEGVEVFKVYALNSHLTTTESSISMTRPTLPSMITNQSMRNTNSTRRIIKPNKPIAYFLESTVLESTTHHDSV